MSAFKLKGIKIKGCQKFLEYRIVFIGLLVYASQGSLGVHEYKSIRTPLSTTSSVHIISLQWSSARSTNTVAPCEDCVNEEEILHLAAPQNGIDVR